MAQDLCVYVCVDVCAVINTLINKLGMFFWVCFVQFCSKFDNNNFILIVYSYLKYMLKLKFEHCQSKYPHFFAISLKKYIKMTRDQCEQKKNKKNWSIVNQQISLAFLLKVSFFLCSYYYDSLKIIKLKRNTYYEWTETNE